MKNDLSIEPSVVVVWLQNCLLVGVILIRAGMNLVPFCQSVQTRNTHYLLIQPIS